MEVLVIGSMNMDLVVETDRIPQVGETLRGKSFSRVPGGKGANQACAIGRLAGNVTFLGACGYDDYGDQLLESLRSAGVDVDSVIRVDGITGVALIAIERNGENRIIIVPGANEAMTPSVIFENEVLFKKTQIVLLQLEIPLETAMHAITTAHRYGKTVILDPAPAYKLPHQIYSKIDYILPNETEMDVLVGSEQATREEKVQELLDLGVKNVILTRGSQGVTLFRQSMRKDFPAERVEVVDTTAAGDAFAGALAHSLGQNRGLEEAIEFANIVAGLTVTRLGAQNSLPHKQRVFEYLRSRSIER